ncbi:restriction system-associated AAA family ATPase [Flavivirga abyssicola]|uniref:restriction system-associated AAA family ATPase n=1 Tax=Flavivirga abyssicola TaxID=3063533 RepID=UPI0026E06ADA|nr:restriction system-associated AAA family ATPase [Flavivirga sp. MEBiC07777]WVK13828.1 restriction system-associated AAA family ATPase [Flavivirga sp. MEBiC07777]
MKLVRLTILEQFRSLKKIKAKKGFEDFTVLFREDEPNEKWTQFHPYCFAGLNGSGKSNVLEALANIFYHLECSTLDSNTSEFLDNDFDLKKSDPIAYELEYYIIPKESEKKSVEDYANVIIRKEKLEAPKIKITAQDQITESVFIEISNPIRSYLPELVIGYSSGENEILSLPFVKSRLLQLDEYYYHLKNRNKLKLTYNLNEKPESSLVYMDYHMSQAILLANFLIQDDDTLEPIKEQLEIDKLHSFRLVINDHKLYHKADDPELGYLLPLADEILEKLRSCATAVFQNTNDKIEILDFYFDQDSKTKSSELKKAFKIHFNSPIELFKAFQILNLLNLRVVSKSLKKEIYNSDSLYAMYKVPSFEESELVFHFNLFKIKKKNSLDKMLLKAFSDGEHQFLHTMGICLILKDKNTLMLLDEPETHFNPEWRSEFISLLKDSLSKSGTNHLMRDILITSHSPFIISDCFPDKVLVFEKGKQPKSAFNMNFRTFGTSVDLIMDNIFNRGNTIGDFSSRIILEIEEEIKNKKSLTEEEVRTYKNRTNDLGDSIEKILLFTKLNELKKK